MTINNSTVLYTLLSKEDVMSLKETVDITGIKLEILDFSMKHTKCNPACRTLLRVLNILSGVEPAPPKNPDGTYIEFDVEGEFKISKGFFNKLTKKARNLFVMLDHAGEPQKNPPTSGNVSNIGMSIVRRIYFIASEKEIREETEGEKAYPFVCIDRDLLNIFKEMFIAIYFSPMREYLLPLYVYGIIGFCGFGGRNGVGIVWFNRGNPYENFALSENVNSFNLIKRVRELKAANKPGTIPYKHQRKTPKSETTETETETETVKSKSKPKAKAPAVEDFMTEPINTQSEEDKPVFNDCRDERFPSLESLN